MKHPWQVWTLFVLSLALVVPAMAWLTVKALELDRAEAEAQRRSLASDYHFQLADAVAAGTPAQADAAMRLHIRRGLAEVLDGLQHLDTAIGAWRLKKHERQASKNGD